MDYYWRDQFRFIESKSNCVDVQWENDDPQSVLFTMMFGKYPNFLKDELASKYVKYLNAHQVSLENKIPFELHNMVTPLDVTKTNLNRRNTRYSSNFMRDGIYIGVSLCFKDLLNFWNLRAAGIKLFFLDLSIKERLYDFMLASIKELWEKKNKSNNFNYIYCFYSQEDSGCKNVLSEIEDSIADIKFIRGHVSDNLWDGFNIKAVYIDFESENTIGYLDNQYLMFKLPSKPLTAINQNSHQQLVLTLKSTLEDYYLDGLTLRFPFIPELNNYFNAKFLDSSNVLRVQKDAVGIVTHSSVSSLRITPVKTDEIIKDIFDFCGLSSIHSKPGKIAMRIIRQLGGIDNCRIFKIRGVRKLIEKSISLKGIEKDYALTTIGKEAFKQFINLYIEKRESPNLTVQDVWGYLLKNNIFRLGITPECPNCLLDYWIPLNLLNDQCKCELCGFEYLLSPQIQANSWRYRLNGLFSIEGKQQGAIPVILTLLQLYKQNHGNNAFVFSTAVEVSDNINFNCEIDLLALDTDGEGTPYLLIGECKYRGNIEQRDIDNLLRVREIITSKNIKCCLLFSKASNFFEKEELLMFKELYIRGLPVILMTNNELEPYEPYESYYETDIPHKSTIDYEEMSQNSYWIYIKEKNINDIQ